MLRGVDNYVGRVVVFVFIAIKALLRLYNLTDIFAAICRLKRGEGGERSFSIISS